MMLFKFLLLVLSTAIDSDILALAFKTTGAGGGATSRPGNSSLRTEINDFATSGPAFDLYILALQRLQDTDQTDQLSYFQVSGIHGYPTIPWDGVLGHGQYPGYCMHGAVTFPIWHRPYLALFEQLVYGHAQTIATTYPVDQRVRYQTAASSLRLPYWDWALNASLPAVTIYPTIFVNTPTGWREIKNPLHRYDFHPGLEGNQFPPSDRLSGAPYTVRHANNQWISNQTAATEEMRKHEVTTMISTYQLLTSPSSYSQFSCNNPGGFFNGANNIEDIHNGIHNWIGGAIGSMTSPGFAAFDPIFWLHHAQIDRIFALWQALNPSNYIVPQSNTVGSYYEAVGTVDSNTSELAPFHSDAANTMFTPERVRDISSLGYTYPELTDLPKSNDEQLKELRRRINNLYNRNIGSTAKPIARAQSDKAMSVTKAFTRINLHTAHEMNVNNLEIQWSINTRVNRFTYNTSFAIDFFLGSPPANIEIWPTSDNLIGTFTQFRLTNPTTSVNVHSEASQQQGEVSLTHILAAGVWRGFLQNLTAEAVVPVLRQNLVWRARTQDYREICLDDLAGLAITVESRTVKSSRHATEFPQYGRYKPHPAATAGKKGGYRTR